MTDIKTKQLLKSILFIFILALLFTFNYQKSIAFTSNSTNYKTTAMDITSGGGDTNSTNYRNIVGTGIISALLNSSGFLNKIGFLYQILLANSQPCTSNSQCEGGYCCSNLCRSTACPSGTGVSTGAAGGGAAGAGGGGGILVPLPETQVEEVKDFRVSPNSLKFTLGLGDSEKETIKIENTGTVAIEIDSKIEEVGDFITLSDTGFVIEKQSSKEVEATAIGKILGSYFGEIMFKGDEIEKGIPVVLEIESKQILFDAKLDIPSDFKKVSPGSELKMQITLLNVGAPKLVDVIVTYLIKGKRGELVHESSETFAVDKQKSYLKSIALPKSLKEGSYLAVIEVRYADSFAVSSEMFSVATSGATASVVKNLSSIVIKNANYIILTVIVMLLAVFYLIYNTAKKR